MATAIALGNFDGVHKAHEFLVRRMTAYASRMGLESVVYLFVPHTLTVLRPEAAPGFLMTSAMKMRRLTEIGVDRVHAEERGKEILSLSPEAFVKNILKDELDAAYVAAGFNYRFGKQAAGDATLLRRLCEENGIRCEITNRIESGKETISSTRLRKLLTAGEIEAVNALSFAPYTLTGVVEEGKKLGREIGFPTLNIQIPRELLLPRKGVYISRTRIGNKDYKSVTNIGQNPTVERAVPRAESHLLDFSRTVYGEEAEITLLSFLRPEQQFADVGTLCRQIRKDTEETKLYFERKDLYGTDTD
ncbi:MAG: bifunctional riboflavin kinase/FAD synthetase [Ruminococcaceae bacterium]|nr:bifunctional riboflavin kinase/FAD synthetase [Oscillospiraceae bacterium]